MKKFFVGMAFVVVVVIAMVSYVVFANGQTEETVSTTEVMSESVESGSQVMVDDAPISYEQLKEAVIAANMKVITDYKASLTQEELDAITSADMLPEDVREAITNIMYITGC